MAEKKFNIQEALAFGWQRMKRNALLFILVFIAIIIVYGIIGAIQRAVAPAGQETYGVGHGILNICNFLLQHLVAIFSITISLTLVSQETMRAGAIFSRIGKYIPFLFSSILYIIIIGIGAVLLLIPGIILSIRLQFFGYLIIDKGCGPIEALKQSWQITKGSFWRIFLFNLACFGVNLCGMLALLVGLFVTIPITLVATGFVYNTLVKEHAAPVIQQPSVS